MNRRTRNTSANRMHAAHGGKTLERSLRGFGRWVAAGLAVLLFGSAMATSGGSIAPAAAMEGASLLVVKTVDGVEAKRDLRPGDSVIYRVEFRVNDEDADAPVRVADVMPEAFLGWEILDLTAVVGNSVNGVTLDLPGVTAGPSPSGPVNGIVGAVGSTAADRTITVGVELPVQGGTGNDSELGMSTRDTGVLEYTIKIPETLSPTDPILRTDLVNTATFTARAGLTDLSTSDAAIISVDNPVAVDVAPEKVWEPAAQSFQAGASSTITIGARQASNVDASRLTLQDPATASDSASALAADNPFNHVDFAGFVGDPIDSANWPAGATAAQIDVYRLSGGSWSWTAWDASIPNGQIAGVRLSYSGAIPPGATASQGFAVEQRATHRTTGDSISTGYAITNKMRATVDVPGQASVSKEDDAPFSVAHEQIDVSAQKRFTKLPNGSEEMNLTGVTAGDTVGVVLRGINSAAPQSTVLDSMTIAEPGTGSHEKFFGDDLAFGGFDSISWPQGATGAQIVWLHAFGPTTVSFTQDGALPTAPAGETVTGFEIVFTGAIAPGASSEIRYRLDTSSDDDFVSAGGTAGPFQNTIDVTGKKAGLPDDTATAGARITLVAPRIDVTLEKRIGPATVLPGQSVVVQLPTEVKTEGGRTKPTEIVVEDLLTGDGTFWDAFDADQILPPISRPTNGSDPAVQANLAIRYQNTAGDWIVLATNPAEDAAIDVPSGATGLRFEYTTNADGFSHTTYVKPNISFTARDTLRSDPSQSTGGTFAEVDLYRNTATAESTGVLDSRTVTGDDTDWKDVGIRGTGGGTGPGPGTGIWTQKDWAHSSLTSQSAATTWTTQSWAVTQGYTTVQLQDPATTTADGAGTAFEAFNLTHIRPIRFAAPANSGTIDPMLRWDLVTGVELFNSTTGVWEAVEAPGGGWMDSGGFKGYNLTAAQQQTTVGVRLVLAENAVARQAAADAGDLTAPAVGSGVAASAEIRTFRLDWQLREAARPASAPPATPKWVTGTQQFNCGTVGCVDNVFRATGTLPGGGTHTSTAGDTIVILDGITNVTLSKQVCPLPLSDDAPLAKNIDMVVPNEGELDQGDYPRARYTLTARNSSSTAEGARGAMKLGKIRVTDTSTHQLIPEPDHDVNTSPFTVRDFATEVNGPDGNHFNEFTLTGVSFGTLPSYIDTVESTVELWLYNAPTGTQNVFTLQQVRDGDAGFAAALPYAIGIAVVYSGDDPARNGNRIAAGDDLVVHLDVQLRQYERLNPAVPVEGGHLDSVVNAPNEAIARGWDPVVAPNTQPTSRSEANIELLQARVRVGLDKQVSVSHGATSDKEVYETDPQAPVSVLLTARSSDDSGNSTAPLNTLEVSDRTADFWNRFEFVSFGTEADPAPQNPIDATRATLKVYVGDQWVDWAGYAGDLADIRGAGVVFDRPEEGNPDGGLFPQGATSWNSSWGTATLPFTVKLREGADVEWGDDSEQNTAGAFAINTQFGSANNIASDEVTFATGTHQLRVIKRASNDASTHQVEPFTSQPWKLVFTNTGTGFLPITRVTDAMPASLEWDLEDPVVTSIPAAGGTSGLTATPTVTPSADGRSLVFEWPEGSRMHPGETVEIDLGLIMQPLPAGEIATNEVIVQAGVPLAQCAQPTDYGQAPRVPASENECSNTNFVQPRAGTVIGARKTVSGEFGETLGENLVNGALDVRTLEECKPINFLPVGSDFTRNPCASYTAVGATDTWKLENFNSGTNPLTRMTVVDMLPNPGDQMLAGGAPRTSTFRPVLVDPNAIRLSGLPAGAAYTVEVTTNATACVGPNQGSSLWVSDPTCSDTAANPANVWTELGSYAGAVEDIVGLRVSIDMTGEAPLMPGGNVVIEFETVNRVIGVSDAGLQPALAQFAERQFAWNQQGVTAWHGNVQVNLPAAPQRAGVTVKTGSLVVSKVVLGEGADNAPASFPVELACTVPSGAADPARVPLDLGDMAALTVPKNGSVTVTGIPIGANCIAQESGPVGAHGESGRSIEATDGVTPATDGLSAEIAIRERGSDDATLLNLANTYTLGELVVEKRVLSGNDYELDADQKKAVFQFELVCQVNGMGDPITDAFQLRADEQYRNAQLPEGAICELTETGTGGARTTTITVAGEQTNGESRDDLLITSEGAHVLVSNVFDGPPPPLQKTGLGNPAWMLAGGLLLLGLGAAVAIAANRRRGGPVASARSDR